MSPIQVDTSSQKQHKMSAIQSTHLLPEMGSEENITLFISRCGTLYNILATDDEKNMLASRQSPKGCGRCKCRKLVFTPFASITLYDPIQTASNLPLRDTFFNSTLSLTENTLLSYCSFDLFLASKAFALTISCNFCNL